MELVKKAVEKIEKSINGKHVMILVDTSGSMYEVIEVIKQAVKELIRLISIRINSKFNIISFSKLITSFSNKMESCTEENINSAYTWISSLICEHATNMLSGLVAAFSEQYCDSLVLFTDSLPNQRPSVVLKFVNELSQNRPINSIYINNGYVDPKVEEFLLSLSLSTNGSSHTLTQFNNALEYKQNFPPCKEITTYCFDSPSSCSETSDDEEIDDSSEDEKISINISDKYHIVGTTVLAKRIHDGYFYKGTVIRSYPDVDEVLVSFLPSKKTLQYESIGRSDILLYDKIKKIKAYAGDRVLVNFDSKKKYVPGTVRDNKYDEQLVLSKILQVELFDGNIKMLPAASIFPINEETYLDCVNSILLNSSHLINKKVVLPTVKRHHCRMQHEIAGNKFLLHNDFKKILTREELNKKIEAQLKESKALLNSLNIYEEPVNYFHHHGSPCYDDYDSGFAGESLEEKGSHVKFTPKPPKFKKLTVEEVDSSDSNTSHSNTSEQQSSNRTRTHTHTHSPQPPSTWNSGHSLPRSQWKRKHSSSVGSNVVERSKKHWLGRPLNKDMSHLKARRFNKKPFADDYQTVDGTPMPRKTDFHVKKQENVIHYQESDIPYQHFQHHDIIGHRVVDYKPVYVQSPLLNTSSSAKSEIKTVQENLKNKVYEKKEKIKKEKEGKNAKVITSYEQREHTKRENEVKKEQENQKLLLKHHKEVDANAYNRIKIIIERDNEKTNKKQKKVKDRIQMEYDREDSKQKQKLARINAMAEKRMNYAANHVDEKTQTEVPPSQKRLDFERQRVENQIQNHEAKIQRLKTLRKYTDARVETLKRKNDKARNIDEYVKNQQLSNSRANILP